MTLVECIDGSGWCDNYGPQTGEACTVDGTTRGINNPWLEYFFLAEYPAFDEWGQWRFITTKFRELETPPSLTEEIREALEPKILIER